MKIAREQRFLVLGIGLHFALVFGSFLPGAHDSINATSLITSPYLFLAYSGIFAALLLPFFWHPLLRKAAQTTLMVGACMVELVSALVIALTPAPAIGSLFYVLACFAFGSATSCTILVWGILLTYLDTEVRERVLVASLLVSGVILLILTIAFKNAIAYVVPAFSLISVMMYVLYLRASQVQEIPATNPFELRVRNIVLECTETAIIFMIVGYIWQFSSSTSFIDGTAEGAQFSLGFSLASIAFTLFVQYSPSVGLASSVRWVFTIIAIGLLCTFSQLESLFPLATILLASAHALSEATLRLQVLGTAARCLAKAPLIVACGFASISLGATAGSLVFVLFEPVDGLTSPAFSAIIYTALVIVCAILPRNTSPDTETSVTLSPSVKMEDEAAQTPASRATAVAIKFGLTAREHQILELLLQGRSHPYIRDALEISISTVDTHVRHIYKKTGVNSRQSLIDISEQASNINAEPLL